MRNIHWIGSGLSSTFGIDELIRHPRGRLHIWMRRPHLALARWRENDSMIHSFDSDHLKEALSPGDIVISMLPYTMHVQIAQIALEKDAHFVCSSYLSPEMLALDEIAKAKGLVIAGEMGLDPGIDHMLAHRLVEEYRKDFLHKRDHTLSFISLCGGIPSRLNDFCYQFSWSPFGILRALRNPSTWLEDGREKTISMPSECIRGIQLNGEAFEYYPNRDSLSFIDYYQLPRERIKNFVRGTLRPKGWKAAWRDIFRLLPGLDEQGLKDLSETLYAKYPYRAGEHDRVVMSIALHVKDSTGKRVKTYSAHLDAFGNDDHHAMTTLVCLPLVTVIDGIIENRYTPGILRPHGSEECTRWLATLHTHHIRVNFKVLLPCSILG
jgi:saccharopine dehydrogenase-like NADP-dependent oxidoreductase